MELFVISLRCDSQRRMNEPFLLSLQKSSMVKDTQHLSLIVIVYQPKMVSQIRNPLDLDAGQVLDVVCREARIELGSPGTLYAFRKRMKKNLAEVLSLIVPSNKLGSLDYVRCDWTNVHHRNQADGQPHGALHHRRSHMLSAFRSETNSESLITRLL